MIIEKIHIIPFNNVMMNMNGIDFLDDICAKYNVGLFALGYNYSFGKNGLWSSGDITSYCKAHNLKSLIFDKFIFDSVEVSSTRIRALIKEGKLQDAQKLLGRPHLIEGTVVEGKKLGQLLDFPTANFIYELDYCYPPHGVYMTSTKLDDTWYYSITNVGRKPTIDHDTVNIETHILDYNDMLYGKKIQIGFLQKLRDQYKFENVQDLKSQLLLDEKNARQLIDQYPFELFRLQ